jgi:nucleotide-binding universal stress UspA family protein
VVRRANDAEPHGDLGCKHSLFPLRFTVMYAIHRILVAIKDPRVRTHPAIAKAAQLARALDAEVCLFHAIPEPVYLDVEAVSGRSLPELEQHATSAHQQRLERIAKPLRHRGIKVTTSVEWDYPSHEAVIRAAAHFGADLIMAECRRTSHVAPVAAALYGLGAVAPERTAGPAGQEPTPPGFRPKPCQ